jgi:hypothetical protein
MTLILLSGRRDNMRNLHLESAIWHLFTSTEFYEAAALECEATMEWFGTLAISRNVANLGRNNQIFDKFKTLARNFRRGADLAALGDYRLIWDTARCFSGDVRGMMEQPLHSWMTEAEYKEFESVRISRLITYAGQIESALHNAMVGADSFFNADPDCPERVNADEAFPGDEIVEWYNAYLGFYEQPLFWKLPDPLPQYVVDTSIACQTGGEVPWTGVWCPSAGLEMHSLTFAIKGLRMQPAYRVVKTAEELEAEGFLLGTPETVAVATTWHPVISPKPEKNTNEDLWAKAGQPCPKSGIWQAADVNASERYFSSGATMSSLGSAYGLTTWRWISDR